MTRSRQGLCLIYAIIAIAALLGTWSQNLHYGPTLAGFMDDAKVNPAARSVTVDVFLVALSAAFFMVFEARRIGVRFVWAYVLFGFTIAISVTFPLFLIAREFRLARQDTTAGVAILDWILLAASCVFIAAIYAYTLFR